MEMNMNSIQDKTSCNFGMVHVNKRVPTEYSLMAPEVCNQ